MKAFSKELPRQFVLVLVGAVSLALLVAMLVLSQSTQRQADLANEQVDNQPVSTQESAPVTEHQTASTMSENTYFKLQLPDGWRADDDPYAGPTSEATFKYKNDQGASFAVIINSANFGGGEGDGGGSFTVVSNRVKLDRSFRFCKPDDELNLCKYGDGKLKIYYSSAENLNGNNYIFDIRHNSAESLEALRQIIDVIETLEAK